MHLGRVLLYLFFTLVALSPPETQRELAMRFHLLHVSVHNQTTKMHSAAFKLPIEFKLIIHMRYLRRFDANLLLINPDMRHGYGPCLYVVTLACLSTFQLGPNSKRMDVLFRECTTFSLDRPVRPSALVWKGLARHLGIDPSFSFFSV